MKKLKLAVLASGRGSNLQALLDASESDRLNALIEVVVSDNPNAYALERARAKGVAAEVVQMPVSGDRDEHDLNILKALEKYNVEAVALAGYMRLAGPRLLKAFPNRIVNIHPALLPAFPGLDTHARALARGVKYSGCTVHFVDDGVDTGPIILQAAVPVLDDDNPESLAARILLEEHRIYPQALEYLAQGRLRIEGSRVRIVSSN